MHVVVGRDGLAPVDMELTPIDPQATVGDLLVALGDGTGPGLVLDGRFCHSELALDEIGLHEGARISPGGPPRDVDAPASAALELRVIAGLDAGRWVALRAGTTITVGRDADCDLRLSDARVSRTHLQVTAGAAGGATVADLGSANGTWVEGRRIAEAVELASGAVFEAGDVALTLAATPPPVTFDPLRHLDAGGTVAFNRPPRLRRPDAPPPLAVPERPPTQERPRLSLVSAIGPLALGAVMVVVLHNLIFALFMLLSPVLVIGGWWEQRRNSSRTARGQGREHARELERFRHELSAARGDELSRRRAGLPDTAELIHRAAGPDARLWERRPEDPDFMILAGGLAKLPFQPPLSQPVAPAAEAEEALRELDRLPPVPAEVDLAGGGAVGIVGPREPALAVARALLCQAATLHGPADLQIAIITDADGERDWEFAKWLPHARDHRSGGSKRLLAADPEAAEALVASLRDRDQSDRRTLLTVLDSPAVVEGRGAVGRALLRSGERVSGIVIASASERLPASCTTVIELAEGTAEGTLRRPQRGELVDPLLAAGVSVRTARDCALALSRFEDADLEIEGGTLPSRVELLELLGMPDPSASELSRRWRQARGDDQLRARFALDQDGPFTIDLVRDGPHGLIAGTTGAGKSELLRSLVASLAASYGPDRLNFVLIDYKGGSAFARCAELPHTVGLVTDLDEQLGERALESLEAELRHRERMLREHGADDVPALARMVAAGAAEPLARLLVVIDEFATMAAELPDFIASLVGIAQRGRSLGVHLLLATQRPSGAVNENIRANTNLRICLRVQTAQDSSDVIESPAAARIGRGQPGRAYVRLGPSELHPIQTALVTGSTQAESQTPVRVAEFTFATAAVSVAGDRPVAPEGGASDLDRFATAAISAGAELPPPRRPWLEPLPADLALEDLLAAGPPVPFAGEEGVTVPMALLDDPPAQAQYPAGWNLEAGNLLLFGIGGSGTTTSMQTLALSLAAGATADALHIYVLDFGAGELQPLEALPHVGAVINANERERQVRLLRWLRQELAARRSGASAGGGRIVLLLDGYAGFAAEQSDATGDSVRDDLGRVWADGPEVGIHVVIGADRVGAVPIGLASLAQQRLVLRLAELSDYAQFGLNRRSIPRFTPGRAVLAATSPRVLQIARSRLGVVDAVARLAARHGAPSRRGPAKIGTLPERIAVRELLDQSGSPEFDPGVLWLPVGIDDETLSVAGWSLYSGEHALIAGPPRSGRTNALVALAQASAALRPQLPIHAVALRRSRLIELPGLSGRATTAEQLTELVWTLKAAAGAALLLVDDADAVDDSGRALSELVGDPDGRVHLIAAGRADGLRALGHWTAGVRASRNGLLLQPDLNLDGGLFGVALPRRPAPPARPGCGYLIRAGAFALTQAALADSR